MASKVTAGTSLDAPDSHLLNALTPSILRDLATKSLQIYVSLGKKPVWSNVLNRTFLVNKTEPQIFDNFRFKFALCAFENWMLLMQNLNSAKFKDFWLWNFYFEWLHFNENEFDFNGDFIESQAFAYLAVRSYLKKPITLPTTTGVKKPCSGGSTFKH